MKRAYLRLLAVVNSLGFSVLLLSLLFETFNPSVCRLIVMFCSVEEYINNKKSKHKISLVYVNLCYL